MPTPKTLTLVAIAVLALGLSSQASAQSTKELQTMEAFLGIMNEYFEIIEATHEVSSSAEKAAIMQMQKIQEVYEARGEKARVVEVLRRVLEETENAAVRNAAYIMLGDVLKDTGRTDEAIQALQRGLAENIRRLE